MMKSLGLKLGMLAMTIGVVLWIGWIRQSAVPLLELSAEGQTTASSHHSMNHVQRQRIEFIPEEKASPPQGRRLLDLNRANADELESLPGIGVVLAKRVIAFRESVGRFRTIDDLRGVNGIGAKKFDRLKSFVTVSTEGTQHETERQES